MFTQNEDESSSIAFSHPILVGVLLFGCFIIALLCYIWAFCSQSHKLPAFKDFLYLSCMRRTSELRGAQNIYYAAFSLLLFDGFTLIFGLVWGILMFCGNVNVAFLIFVNIWLAFRFFSQCQHLITALISILFAYHPSWRDGLRGASKVLNLVPFILIILSFKIHDGILIGVDVFNFFLVVGIVVSWCLSTSSPIAHQRTPFGLMSVLFYLIICLPTAVINCMVTHSDHHLVLAVDVLLFTNFYMIMSALLFRMVLKLEDGNQSDNHQYECAISSA